MLKLLILTFLVLSLNHAMALEIKGVSICAAKCNSESLGVVSHDEAVVGTIYYAKATTSNLTNSNVCLENSKIIKITSNRLIDNSLHTCVDAMLGKYFGKTVNLNTESINFSTDENNTGSFFEITISERK